MGRFAGLWRNPEFLKLWGGQSISILGSSVTSLALPTTAILVLDANAFQVGLLNALVRLPFPVLALAAGAWVDRLQRRPLMIAADVGLTLTLGSIPLAAILGVLTLYQLYAVALISGFFRVVFDVSYLAYFPGLVGRESVLEGNTKLQFSASVTSLAGPALAGLLIRVMGPARAIAVDSASFMLSALALVWIRKPEAQPVASGRSGLQDIGDGLRFVFKHPVLRDVILIVGASILGAHAVESVQLPFAYQQLQLSPSTLGLALSAGGVGAIAGVMVIAPIIRALGVGPAIGLSGFALGAGLACQALAAWLPPVPTLVAVIFTLGFFDPIHNVTQQSLRQGATPDALQGRMNATFRTVYWGAWPLGNLLGGVLGVQIGLVQTIVLGGAWTALASLLVFATGLRHVRAHPTLEMAA